MEYQMVANTDALTFLERINTATATLLYFDPPAGTSADGTTNDQLRLLYLHAACHAKRVLHNNGVLVWHVLPTSASDVRSCLDRVFGSQFFASEIVLKRQRRSNTKPIPTTNHTSLIIYSKSGEFFYEAPTRSILDAKHLYTQNDDKGSYRLRDITMPMNRPNLYFTWNDFTPPVGRSWRYTHSKLEELFSDGRIMVSKSDLPARRSI